MNLDDVREILALMRENGLSEFEIEREGLKLRLRKDAAHLTEWAKDVAPSTELRKWYGHDPEKLNEFRVRYLDELSGRSQRAELGKLRALAATGPVTLLTATRDVDISQAAVLAQVLRQPLDDEGGEAACWAHLVCPECGAIEAEGHRAGCALA